MYNLLIGTLQLLTKFRYGCNIVTPRSFTEVRSIYSRDMASVIKGGLIYEFTEEPNNYGLVRVLPDRNIQLLQDFHLASIQLNSIPSSIYYQEASIEDLEPPKCEDFYRNLFTTKTLPRCVAQDLVNKGVRVQPGSYVELTDDLLQSPYKVFDVDGSRVYLQPTHVNVVLPLFYRSNSVSGTYYTPLDSSLVNSMSYSDSSNNPEIPTDSVDDTLHESIFRLWAWSDDESDRDQEAEEGETILKKATKTFDATWKLLQAMASKVFGGDKTSD